MSRPFIIWTMQRTGGTALAELLMALSEHPSVEHEPFNWSRKQPRQFWPIADRWNRTQDAHALATELDAIFTRNVLIKHCYELLAMPFNEHLMQAAAKSPYRHIHLLRRDEMARLTSKFIAESQGTWFPDYARQVFGEVIDGRRPLAPLPVDKLVSHFHHCRATTATVTRRLADLGASALCIYYEDLYQGIREARRAELDRLFDFLEFEADDLERGRVAIDSKIFSGGQHTKRVASYVPNMAQVTDALRDAGCDSPSEASARQQGHGSMKPRQRMVAEFRRLVELQSPIGPFLEIGVAAAEECAVAGDDYAGVERHAVGASLAPGTTPNGLILHEAEIADVGYRFSDASFGTVLWNDALVHDRYFWRTLQTLYRLLAPGGLIILSAPGFSKAANQAGVTVAGPQGKPIPDTTPTYRIHDSPDFWRISPQAMRHVVLDGYEVRDVRVSSMPPRIFGVGVKPLSGATGMPLAAD